MNQFPLDFSAKAVTVAPSAFPQARETSALAAIQVQPIRGQRNLLLLQLLKEAGELGLSDIEIQRLTGWPRQTICVRRFDCRSRIVPAETRYEVNGRKYTKWRLIDDHT